MRGGLQPQAENLPRRGRKPEGLEQAPQRLRMAEWLLVHGLEGTFRQTRTSEAKIFRAREEPKISTTLYTAVALDSNQTEPGAGAPAPAYGGVVTAFESRRENGKASELRSEAFSALPPNGINQTEPEGSAPALTKGGVVTGSSQSNVYSKNPGTSFRGSCYICSPDWTRTSNPSINSRMLCQLSYGGIFCFRCAVSLTTSNNYTGGLRTPQAEI